MTGSVILDVIIGLVFIFLFYSLLATIIQKMIATKFAFRAKVLEKAIIRMLQDGNTTSTGNIILDRSLSFWHFFSRKNMLRGKQIASWFYAHPLVKYLGEDNCYSKPAYLSAQNFSHVMLDLLHGVGGNEINMLKVREAIAIGRIEVFPLNEADYNNPAMRALGELDAKSKKIIIPQAKTSDNTIDIDPETTVFLQSL